MKEFNSQVCTTKEQSQRLLELGLKPETADMVLIKELAYKNLKRLVTYKDIPCYICGYSVEFDCLIAGYNGSYGIECFPSPDDKFIDGATYNHYLYVPKDIVKE